MRQLTHTSFELATYKEMADFLAEVERRAYKQAMFAIRDEHQALDVVQDAMFKISEKYSDRPASEFPMLFQRILQNTIRDFLFRASLPMPTEDVELARERRFWELIDAGRSARRR